MQGKKGCFLTCCIFLVWCGIILLNFSEFGVVTKLFKNSKSMGVPEELFKQFLNLCWRLQRGQRYQDFLYNGTEPTALGKFIMGRDLPTKYAFILLRFTLKNKDMETHRQVWALCPMLRAAVADLKDYDALLMLYNLIKHSSDDIVASVFNSMRQFNRGVKYISMDAAGCRGGKEGNDLLSLLDLLKFAIDKDYTGTVDVILDVFQDLSALQQFISQYNDYITEEYSNSIKQKIGSLSAEDKFAGRSVALITDWLRADYYSKTDNTPQVANSSNNDTAYAEGPVPMDMSLMGGQLISDTEAMDMQALLVRLTADNAVDQFVEGLSHFDC